MNCKSTLERKNRERDLQKKEVATGYWGARTASWWTVSTSGLCPRWNIYLLCMAWSPGVFQSPCPSRQGLLPLPCKLERTILCLCYTWTKLEVSQPLLGLFVLNMLSGRILKPLLIGEPAEAAFTSTQLLLLQGDYLISKPDRSNAAGAGAVCYLSPCPEAWTAEQMICSYFYCASPPPFYQGTINQR